MDGMILLGNIKGQKGDTGKGLTILGYYATPEELSSAVTNPSIGDAYGVGSEHPYDIYIYSQNNGWVNNGQLQGAKGDKGDKGEKGEQGPQGEKGDKGDTITYAGVDGKTVGVTVESTRMNSNTIHVERGGVWVHSVNLQDDVISLVIQGLAVGESIEIEYNNGTKTVSMSGATAIITSADYPGLVRVKGAITLSPAANISITETINITPNNIYAEVKDGSIGMSKLDDEVKGILTGGGISLTGDDGEVVIPEEVTTHLADNVKHLTADEHNGLSSAIAHTNNSSVHITDEERANWNSKASGEHVADTVKHITSAERTAWNTKAPGGHGLGERAKEGYNTSFLEMFQMGGGFYQVSGAYDTPTTSDPSWVSLMQCTRGTEEGNETGVQLAFYDWIATSPRMWLRNVFKGTAGNWVEMLHTGNIGNYVSSDSPKLVSGSYTGTGTYVNGQETPTNIAAGQNKLTFPAFPRVVLIKKRTSYRVNAIIVPNPTTKEADFVTYGDNKWYQGRCSGTVNDDNSLTWYALTQVWKYKADLTTGDVSIALETLDSDSYNIKAYGQLNEEGVTYDYVAICY